MKIFKIFPTFDSLQYTISCEKRRQDGFSFDLASSPSLPRWDDVLQTNTRLQFFLVTYEIHALVSLALPNEDCGHTMDNPHHPQVKDVSSQRAKKVKRNHGRLNHQ